MLNNRPKLYIIPSPIIEGQIRDLSPVVIDKVHQLRHFIAEQSKTARHFIKTTNPPYQMSEIEVESLDKHNDYAISEESKTWLTNGLEIGLLSEAGCPGIADPGHKLVRMAREYNYQVVPLIGPSSIILALMASGLNGQQFCFHGYLPIEKSALRQKLRKLEEEVKRSKYSQIFIETPYRNHKLFEALLKHLDKSTSLSISLNLTSKNEFCDSFTIAEWKIQKDNINLHKQPAVFIIGAS